MIPADHITFDGDMAWTVSHIPGWGGRPSGGWVNADRPCDDCGGDPLNTLDDDVCPADCIDGRHTFEIEVATSESKGFGEFIDTYRVSIVPGMVLPIVDTLPESGYQVEGQRAVFNDPAWPGESFIRNIRGDIDGIAALPPAAKPGMWAVQLNVQPKEQQ